MRIVAITRILNEADMVEGFIRHAASDVDHHILIDNGSTDGTMDILHQLRGEGISLEIYRHAEVIHTEGAQLYSLCHLAVMPRGVAGAHQPADWVVPLDTDEMLDTSGLEGGLRGMLSRETGDVVAGRVREYVPSPHDVADELLVPARVTHARAPSDNLKVMLRGGLFHRGATLLPGAHGVMLNGEPLPPRLESDLFYAHYGVRSVWQWISKFTVGWSRLLAAGPAMAASGLCSHYRGPYEALLQRAPEFFADPSRIESRIHESDLTFGPAPYRGGALRYTRPVNYAARAAGALMQHLDSLAKRCGELEQAEQQRRQDTALPSPQRDQQPERKDRRDQPQPPVPQARR